MLVCLFFVPINIYQTELFNPRNPYDTDLPVIEDARELSYSFFFRFLFGLERGGWTFFCWLLEFLFEMSRRLHTHTVIQVKLLPTYPMCIYSPIERWFNITPPQKTLIGLNYNNNNHKKATNAGVRRNF